MANPSADPPALARGGGQTLYGFTLQQGIQSDLSHPFFTLAKTGDPFAGQVSGSPVFLVLPASAGGDTSVCDQDGSGLGATTSGWHGYEGLWNGTFSISAKGTEYHLSYNSTPATGGGSLNLVVNKPAVKSNGNLTLTFTNVRGLVSAYSKPDGGPYDPQDRCLTFSITAVP